ncbi:MAG: hypothetical protein K1X72_27490 [Pyrinomonadaceae bacterium]|nr:hypothetical protein [Pyrinomonadaceae bacterium]
MFKLQTILAILVFSISALACIKTEADSQNYEWQNVTVKADYPIGYNYPVFIVDGKMLALNNGGWFSEDGKNWTKSPLPKSNLNSAYQKFVQFRGAIYALGEMQGNYLNFKISTKISRTRDGKTWETVAEKSNLPERVFYGAVVFKDKIWLIGGWDGKKYYNDVWNSADGVNWTKAAEKTDWSPRTLSKIIVFKNRLWIIGGGVIDGEKTDNPNSEKEIWSTADGINWTQSETNASNQIAGTPIVFDNKLWLVGANRNNGFASGVLFSEDGENWQEMNAPWSPRGAVAVWVFDNKLFMTGGKYSYIKNGETKFVYSNDVWTMSKVN